MKALLVVLGLVGSLGFFGHPLNADAADGPPIAADKIKGDERVFDTAIFGDDRNTAPAHTPVPLLSAAIRGPSASSASQAVIPAGGIKRTILQRFDIEGGREVIVGLAEIAPGASAGRHSHPGVETGYVIEGSATLEIDGEPTRLMKAGESYLIPAGKVHDARAVGSGAARVIATYVVEKGKPLSTPAP